MTNASPHTPILNDLIAMAHALARALHDRALAQLQDPATPQPEDPTIPFDRIARCIRRTVALATKLEQPRKSPTPPKPRDLSTLTDQELDAYAAEFGEDDPVPNPHKSDREDLRDREDLDDDEFPDYEPAPFHAAEPHEPRQHPPEPGARQEPHHPQTTPDHHPHAPPTQAPTPPH